MTLGPVEAGATAELGEDAEAAVEAAPVVGAAAEVPGAADVVAAPVVAAPEAAGVLDPEEQAVRATSPAERAARVATLLEVDRVLRMGSPR